MHRTRTFVIAWCSAVLLAAALTSALACQASAQTTTAWFLTERSSGYRYSVSSGHLSDIPADVWNVDFDDSSWTMATSPFGTGEDICFSLASATPWELPALTGVAPLRWTGRDCGPQHAAACLLS